MNKKKILFGSLCAGSVLAITRLLFAKPASSEEAEVSKSYNAVDAYIDEQMRRLRIPGVSLAVIEGDRIVHFRGFGRAHPGGKAPTLQTPFLIGSLTKSFTALAVMQLVEAGKIELDTPVQQYLPWFRVADVQASARITVRHLLNQTSGLPYFSTNLDKRELDDRPGANERLVRALSKLKLSNLPGEKCIYSNWNYDILGLIIEVASPESYADYIQNHIFNPLQMHHSFATKSSAQQHGLAMGHRHWFGCPVPAQDLPFQVASLASGWLISCAEDMAHYLIAHLNPGNYGGVQVLSPAGMDELHRGAVEYVTFGISSGSYAMGWFDQELGGTRVISHSGNVPDFSAFMGFIPAQHKGLVMLLNADPYGLPPITEEFGLNTTAVLAGQPPGPNKLEFVQWVFRLLPLIPALQVAGAITTLRGLNRWRADPTNRPSKGLLWRRHILLPLVLNLSFAAFLVYLKSTGLINFLHFYMPDLAWIARLSGGFALIWSTLRTALLLQALGKKRF